MANDAKIARDFIDCKEWCERRNFVLNCTGSQFSISERSNPGNFIVGGFSTIAEVTAFIQGWESHAALIILKGDKHG